MKRTSTAAQTRNLIASRKPKSKSTSTPAQARAVAERARRAAGATGRKPYPSVRGVMENRTGRRSPRV